MQQNGYRSELKYYINSADVFALRQRLRCLAQLDEHAGPRGVYRIRSLYFDNYRDKAMVEKFMGVSRREKFRLRYYEGDTSLIRLEKKSKVKRLVKKETAIVNEQLCAALLAGRLEQLKGASDALLGELYVKLQTQQLRPRAIVDYDREAYVYAPGNVRITIDSNIRMSDMPSDFLTPKSVTIPAASATVLEIKYDAFLPDIMRDAVQLGGREQTEFSKYVVSRLVAG